MTAEDQQRLMKKVTSGGSAMPPGAVWHRFKPKVLPR